MAIKLVCINIEGQKHLERVKAFLAREAAEVVCMAEVFEDTLATLTEGYPYVEFAPGYLADQNEVEVTEGTRKWGEVIMSKYPLRNVSKTYLGAYDSEHLPRHGADTHEPVLIVAEVETGEGVYAVATVHGSWTQGGVVTERQKKEMGKIGQILSGREVVIGGDFNVPRGNEVYELLVSRYHDNIPAGVNTTIDPNLHYANRDEPGRLALVVDYVFSTPQYKVTDLEVVAGISDHCALKCTIHRQP